MYTLKRETKVTAITALTEGASIRSVERMTGAHRDTIMRLMVRVGRRRGKRSSDVPSVVSRDWFRPVADAPQCVQR